MAMTYDQINDLRRRIIKGEQVSEEELRESIASLAELRSGAAASADEAKTKSRKKKDAAPSVDAQSLLDKLQF